ncbi:MAG TPA: F0F1 ATP synthase subunit epsilon, partial [Micrococcus luteus]|nr:F0F1 ATP synthase subunit epsilon [Salmonella enterica subsp. enterica serovar Typhimurium]HAY86582.1 F0F1 ATP synthase subunit epsilon [Micrococcus luteus]
MAELNVEIVSEERSIWSGAASAVSARTVNGEIGILPGHTPML